MKDLMKRIEDAGLTGSVYLVDDGDAKMIEVRIKGHQAAAGGRPGARAFTDAKLLDSWLSGYEAARRTPQR